MRAQQTSALLAEIAADEAPQFNLNELLARFHQRAFGVMLLAAVLPALLPIPVGVGAVVGVLVVALGLQMVFRLTDPWLPRRIRERSFERATLRRLTSRLIPLMRRVERVTRPRLELLFDGVIGNLISGLMLIAMGILLSLPIPLTNYPFGLLLLAYALALIERDGALLLLVWLLILGLIASFAGVMAESFHWLAASFS